MYSPNVPILHKMKKQILKLTWNLKRSWRNKAILRGGEKQFWKNYHSRFQEILQSYCNKNKNNMVLGPKWKTPMDKQNSRSKHNCTKRQPLISDKDAKNLFSPKHLQQMTMGKPMSLKPEMPKLLEKTGSAL